MDEYTLEKLAAYFDEEELDSIFDVVDDDELEKTAAYEEELGEVMGLGYSDEIEKIAALIEGDPAAEYYEAGRELALEELGLEKDAMPASQLLNILGSKAGAAAGSGAKYIAGLGAAHPSLAMAAKGATAAAPAAALTAASMLAARPMLRHGRKAAKGLAKSFKSGVLLNNRVTGKVLSPARKARDLAKAMRNRNLALAAATGGGAGYAGSRMSKKSSDTESLKNAIKMAILNGQA